MKACLSTFIMRLKLETQYRAAAFAGLATQLFFGFILIFLYRAVYPANTDSQTLAATATYVWLQQAFFRMILSSEGELSQAILNGDMVYHLVRPIDQYSFWFARVAAMKLVSSLMRGIPLIIIALFLPAGIGLSLPVSLGAFLAFLFSLTLGLFTVTAIEAVSSGFILLLLDNRGINALIELMITFFAGNLLPLTLFPESWQTFLRLQPFSQVLDAPIRLYTGEYPLSTLPQVAGLQIFWLVLLILLGRLIWNHSLRRIIVQGG